MNSEQLAEDIRLFCSTQANEAMAIKYSRYFKESLYDGYGISAPVIHGKARELALTTSITLDTVLKSAEEIIAHGRSEEISIIMLLAKKLHKQFTARTFKEIEHWYSIGINNWAHADTLGMLVLPIFLKKRLISMDAFSGWLTSANKYQRRSVPVTLIKELKTHENFNALFSFIECLITDPEREVHQGTGWFLREAWKRKPAITEDFLMKWKDTAPRLIIQYATEKMPREYKLKFKKLKK